MLINTAAFSHRFRILPIGLAVAASVLIAGCGPMGDDDDSTATSETVGQPTTESTVAGDSTSTTGSPPSFAPGIGDDDDPTPTETYVETGPAATPASGLEDASTPAPSDGVNEAPSGTSASDSVDGATPAAASEQLSSAPDFPSFAGSDGTSGATPGGGEAPSAEVADGGATPGATPDQPFFTREETTPDPDATAVDGDLTTLAPYNAASCSPDSVQPLPGGDAPYVTISEVNFREGPGADCNTLQEEPLALGTELTVTGAPVVREGEEDLVWIRVDVNGEEGWLVIDALQPADSD